MRLYLCQKKQYWQIFFYKAFTVGHNIHCHSKQEIYVEWSYKKLQESLFLLQKLQLSSFLRSFTGRKMDFGYSLVTGVICEMEISIIAIWKILWGFSSLVVMVPSRFKRLSCIFLFYYADLDIFFVFVKQFYFENISHASFFLVFCLLLVG